MKAVTVDADGYVHWMYHVEMLHRAHRREMYMGLCECLPATEKRKEFLHPLLPQHCASAATSQRVDCRREFDMTPMVGLRTQPSFHPAFSCPSAYPPSPASPPNISQSIFVWHSPIDRPPATTQQLVTQFCGAAKRAHHAVTIAMEIETADHGFFRWSVLLKEHCFFRGQPRVSTADGAWKRRNSLEAHRCE